MTVADEDTTVLRAVGYHARREWYTRSDLGWTRHFPRPGPPPTAPPPLAPIPLPHSLMMPAGSIAEAPTAVQPVPPVAAPAHVGMSSSSLVGVFSFCSFIEADAPSEPESAPPPKRDAEMLARARNILQHLTDSTDTGVEREQLSASASVAEALVLAQATPVAAGARRDEDDVDGNSDAGYAYSFTTENIGGRKAWRQLTSGSGDLMSEREFAPRVTTMGPSNCCVGHFLGGSQHDITAMPGAKTFTTVLLKRPAAAIRSLAACSSSCTASKTPESSAPQRARRGGGLLPVASLDALAAARPPSPAHASFYMFAQAAVHARKSQHAHPGVLLPMCPESIPAHNPEVARMQFM